MPRCRPALLAAPHFSVASPPARRRACSCSVSHRTRRCCAACRGRLSCTLPRPCHAGRSQASCRTSRCGWGCSRQQGEDMQRRLAFTRLRSRITVLSAGPRSPTLTTPRSTQQRWTTLLDMQYASLQAQVGGRDGHGSMAPCFPRAPQLDPPLLLLLWHAPARRISPRNCWSRTRWGW